MKKIIRFGTFVREITIRQKQVSYNELTPKVEKNEHGEENRLKVLAVNKPSLWVTSKVFMQYLMLPENRHDFGGDMFQ